MKKTIISECIYKIFTYYIHTHGFMFHARIQEFPSGGPGPTSFLISIEINRTCDFPVQEGSKPHVIPLDPCMSLIVNYENISLLIMPLHIRKCQLLVHETADKWSLEPKINMYYRYELSHLM